MEHALNLRDFADLFGTHPDDIQNPSRALIETYNFQYRSFPEKERNSFMKEIDLQIESGRFSVSGKEKKMVWSAAWRDMREKYEKNNYEFDNLNPDFIQANQPLRLRGNYILPANALFQYHWSKVFKNWIFRKYLQDVDFVYDFGCGSGIDCAMLAETFPQKKLHGLDWAQSSLDFVSLVAKKNGWNIETSLFDMFSPDENYKIEKNSAVIAFSAFEQLGINFHTLIDFFLKKKPALVLHVDILEELFDRLNPFDAVAAKFAEKRNYLRGYLTHLKKLEAEGKIEIIKIQRVPFGSMHCEGYSYDVWRPL